MAVFGEDDSARPAWALYIRGPQGTPRDGMDGMERSSFSGFQRQFFENPG
jgi:hypothetical protein